MLEEYNDVFADIVNVLLFNGKRLVKEDDLEVAQQRSFYKAEGKIRELERDTSKYWRKSNIRIALIGFENQTDSDKYMPVRIIGYDGANYRAQIVRMEEQKKAKVKIDPLYPVITVVLYFGRTPWGKGRKLSDILDIPEEIKPYFNDYKINLFEISYLSDEQVNMFSSDFRYVAEYFVQTRKNKDYVPTYTTLKHVDAILKLMSVMTGDNRFEIIINEREEKKAMGRERALDLLEQRGIEKGLEQGLVQGRNSVIEGALRNGKTPELIAEFNNIPLETVLKVQSEMLEEA